jgi:hypothetical protein
MYWFTGQQALTPDEINKDTIFMTTDPQFASNYGKLFRIIIRHDAVELDVNDEDKMDMLVDNIFADYDNDRLSYEMNDWIERVIDEYGDEAREEIYDKLTPDDVYGEAAYDMHDLQVWIYEQGYDYIVFGDGDTGILLNREAVIIVECDEQCYERGIEDYIKRGW